MSIAVSLRNLLGFLSPAILLGTTGLLGTAGIAAAAPPPPTAPAPIVAPFDAEQAHANQELWAKHLKIPVIKKNAIGMSMVLIPPGEFMMGSTPEQVAEGQKLSEGMQNPGSVKWTANRCLVEMPQHRVTLTRPMLFSATLVTVGDFRRFIQLTGYVTETERRGGGNSMKEVETNPQSKDVNWSWNRTDEKAVTQITWNDAARFCLWLSTADKLKPSYRQDAQGGMQLIPNSVGYRLPTEAEWEYACRAGTTTQFWFGDSPAELAKYTFDPVNPPENAAPGIAPPNPFGLYDMMGLCRQWCQDVYADGYYASSPAVNPPGPTSGNSRVIRGTGLTPGAAQKRSAFRFSYPQQARFGELGFRVVRFATITPAGARLGPASHGASLAAPKP